jgi:hypothetical protein
VPLYPGVVQRGDVAVSEWSGAVLAVAPATGSMVVRCSTRPIDDRAGGTLARIHLDPASGRALFVDVIRKGDGPSIEVLPDRWARARQA